MELTKFVFSAAGEDNSDDASTALDKVLDSAASCIHVAHMQDILKNNENILKVISIALSPGFSWTGNL